MNTPWTIRDLRRPLAAESLRAPALAETALARANQNAGRNTYIWQDAARTRAEADRAEAMPRGSGGPFGDGRPAPLGYACLGKRPFRSRRALRSARYVANRNCGQAGQNYHDASGKPIANGGSRQFTTPGRNHDGDGTGCFLLQAGPMT